MDDGARCKIQLKLQQLSFIETKKPPTPSAIARDERLRTIPWYHPNDILLMKNTTQIFNADAAAKGTCSFPLAV